MADYISLTCPSCGSKLQIKKEIERFSCSSCGNEYIVNRGGGIVSLAPVVEGLREIKVGVDKTASELAIKRLKYEIPEFEKKIDQIARSTSSGMVSFSSEYEYLLDIQLVGRLKPNEYDKIIAELDKQLIEWKREYYKKERNGFLRKAISKVSKGLNVEYQIKDFECKLDEYKNMVAELKEKQLQLANHKKIVNQR
ncbi:MAG: hypothetical protein HOG15_11560 [Anaerolineae bacterium]|jgi:hypothetical protein|nr:hypothetical protein [Anaerolineae bacterium]